MSIFRQGRFFYWLIKELTDKYTKLFTIGIILGALCFISIKKLSTIAPIEIGQGVERIAVVGDYTVSDIPASILSLMSYGLTTIEANGSPSAGLSDAWEATDSGKTYIFHLNPTKTWHDGTKVVAKDINYQIRGVTIETPDPQTIVFHTDTPYSPFPVVVGRPVFKKGLVGVGSYTLGRVRIKAGMVQTLLLNPVDSKLKQKQYTFYKTETAAITAYKLGEIDRLEGLETLPPQVTSWTNTEVIPEIKFNRVLTLFFNTSDNLLRDKAIRQGIAYSLPKFPDTEPAFSPIQKTSWAYEEKVKHYDPNEKLSKQLLKDILSATSSAELTLNTFTPYLPAANIIADHLEKLGLKITVKVEETLPSSYQMLLTARDLPVDPDQYAFWQSTQENTNISNYVNVKIDKLLEDARLEQDYDKRNILYSDFQKRLVDDAPAVFLYHPTTYTIVRK